MSGVSEEIKVKSHEEAQELADAIGKGVTWERPSQYPPFQPELGLYRRLSLRFWLTRKRTLWFIQKILFKITRRNKR